jgi:hypothetical protein
MKKYENEYVMMWIEDGILFSSYKEQVTIDKATAEKIVSDRMELTKGMPYYILIDFNQLKSVTKDARDYMNSPEGGMKGLLGGAFVSNNVVASLFVNLYLKVNKPPIPARFFTSKSEAVQWLKAIKQKQSFTKLLACL